MRIENRPKHFESLHVLHSRACFGVPGRADAAAWTHYARGRAAMPSRLSGADCNGDGHRNERSHNTSEKSVQNCAFQSRNFEADPKSDLASVGHGLELPAFFPW